MLHAPIPPDESERLAKLLTYGILDTEAEQAFDDLVRLAAFICDAPISVVSIIDSHRLWFKAIMGLGGTQADRDTSFCGHTILGTETMVVPDTLEDERFADNPFVTSDPNVRFYAGTPLRTADGYALGSLCVVDQRPRTLTVEQLGALELLGRQCVQLFELRLANNKLATSLSEGRAVTAALEVSRAHVHAVTESALDAIVSADAHGTIISWNAAADRIFGFTSDEILGLPLTTIMPERFRAAHVNGLARMAAGGPTTITGKTVLLQGLRKDGLEFDLELSLGSWWSPEGRFFSGIMRDVTAARQATEMVREERDFTAGVLDATDALIIVLSPNGKITRFNHACERVSGYTADEVMGRFFDFLLPPDQAEGVAEAFEDLTATALSGRYENQWLGKDGTKRLIAWSNTVLSDADGAVVHVIGTGIDITDRRRAESELGRQSAIMTSVLEHMGDGVIVTDEHGQNVLWNRAAERMLGRGPQDRPPETWPASYGLYLPDRQTKLDPNNTPIARALRGEDVHQFEIFVRTPLFVEGRWHSITASPVKDAAQRIIGTTRLNCAPLPCGTN